MRPLLLDGCGADGPEDSGSDAENATESTLSCGSLRELPRSATRVDRKMGWSSLLRTHAVIDSEDATYVIVFTRAREPGSVDPDRLILDPQERARQIFVRPEDQEIEGLGSEPVRAAVYHELVRQRIQALLLRSGFMCSSFPSVDGDETFLKIHLDPEGETVYALAEHFEYRVPLSRKCYKSTKQITNQAGWTCFAHTAFTRKLHQEGKLQPFRQVDLIRIAYQHLSSLVNLEQLLLQEFIVTQFPAAGFEELRALEVHWTLPLHCRAQLVPRQVKDYFGEKIAFYVHFFIFYIRALCVLSLIALPFTLVKRYVFPADVHMAALVNIGFGAAVVLWAVFFEVILVRSIARTAQGWGTNEARLAPGQEVPGVGFDPSLAGTRRERQLHVFAALCSASYCMLFVLGVMVINSQRLNESCQKTKAWLIAALIVVAKKVWGMIAPWLTRLENHRTQKRFDDELTLRLSALKIFFLLWPALDVFVFEGHSHCAGTRREAAEMVYGALPLNGSAPKWPRGEFAGELNVNTYEELLAGYYLDSRSGALNTLWHLPGEGHMVCLSSCLPQEDCVRVHDRVDCKTNCHVDFEYQIHTQFVLHVASSLLLTVVPLVFTKRAIRQDFSAAQRQNAPRDHAQSRAAEYSDLEVQAKCQINAKYEYAQWGGSFVEDFLELMLGFAYITIFAMVKPAMILIATVAQLVEYGLLVLRMRLVTGRPYPEAAADIGKWRLVIVMVGTVAAFFNGYIAAFVIRPAWFTGVQRWLVFLVFGGVSLLVRTIVRNVVPDQPHDVRLIDDYNADVLRHLRPVVETLQFEEGHRQNHVDIRLCPDDMPDVGAMSTSLVHNSLEALECGLSTVTNLSPRSPTLLETMALRTRNPLEKAKRTHHRQ